MGSKVWIHAVIAVLGGASSAGCNALTAVDDYAYDRACAQKIVATAEDCSTADIDENCDGVPRCSADDLWGLGFGRIGAQLGRAVAFDPARNVLVAGTFEGEADLSGGVNAFTTVQGQDVYLAKFDPSGKPLWQRQFGGTGDQTVRGVAVDGQGNVILVGRFTGEMVFGETLHQSNGQGDIFVAKISSSGAVVWSKAYGNDQDQVATAVAVDPSGNVLFTGAFAGTLDFGSGADQLQSVGALDVFVAKLAPGGSPAWSQRFGDVNQGVVDQVGSAIAAGPRGEVYVGGKFQGSLVVTPDGPVTSTGLDDAFVMSFNAKGELRWALGMGDAAATGAQQVTSMATDPDGNLLVSGLFTGRLEFAAVALASKGGADMFLAKLTPTGEVAWANGYGTADDEVETEVATDGARNVLLTGSILGALDFGDGLKPGNDPPTPDIFIAKLDANGAAITTPRFVATGFQRGHDIATDSLGNIAVTGAFNGRVTFEDVELESVAPSEPAPPLTDAFVTVFRP